MQSWLCSHTRTDSAPSCGKFYQVAFRKKHHLLLKEHRPLDAWLVNYSNEQTHQAKLRYRHTPLQTLTAEKEAWKEKAKNFILTGAAAL